MFIGVDRWFLPAGMVNWGIDRQPMV